MRRESGGRVWLDMGMTDLSLNGVHHISCITGDAPGNVEFYAGLMGMRLVKKTVNQDDPSVYHLFYGDEKGSPGFDLTFFEYPGCPQGPGRCRHGSPDSLAGRFFGVARLLGRASRSCRGRHGPQFRRGRGVLRGRANR